MANRHKKKAGGGSAMASRNDYSGSVDPNVVKDAKEKKVGGSVDMMVKGAKAKERVKKARGGGVGSDMHPFSSAHRGG